MKNGYYTLKDFLDGIDGDKVNMYYFNVVGENMSVKFGDGFKDLVYNKIIQITRRIANCYLLTEDGDYIPADETIDLDTMFELEHVIEHNIEALANAKDGANISMDGNNGVNHSLQSANPLTQNTRALNDNMSYNQLDIQIKQNKVLGEFTLIFEKMREEFKQYVEYIKS